MTSVLDEQIATAKRQVGIGYWDEQHQRVGHSACVVLVEGDDDRIALELALNGLVPDWPQLAAVVALGGRAAVLDALRRRALPHSFPLSGRVVGLVDRDTWTEAEVERQRQQHPGLVVTDGWCLESNLLVGPEDHPAWSEQERLAWVQSGALGWARQRAYAAWRTPDALWAPDPRLDFADVSRLTRSLQALGEELHPTPDALRIEEIARVALERLGEILTLAADAQWLLGVHGKEAFKQLLVPRLNHGRKPLDATRWRAVLAPRLARADFVREIAAALRSDSTPPPSS